MSWRSRQRKKFNRLVERHKKATIIQIGNYLFVACENPFKDKFTYLNAVNKSYADKIEKNAINSYLDFDSYFNPDLTLNVYFEKNKEKQENTLIRALTNIGECWCLTVKKYFPNMPHTIILYYNLIDEEWFLDFYNGQVNIDEMQKDGHLSKIVLISNT